jgi:hypothetical protein
MNNMNNFDIRSFKDLIEKVREFWDRRPCNIRTFP